MDGDADVWELALAARRRERCASLSCSLQVAHEPQRGVDRPHLGEGEPADVFAESRGIVGRRLLGQDARDALVDLDFWAKARRPCWCGRRGHQRVESGR